MNFVLDGDRSIAAPAARVARLRRTITMPSSLMAALRLRAVNTKRKLASFFPNAYQVGSVYRNPDGLFALPATDTSFSPAFRKGKSYGAGEVDRINSLIPAGISILVVGGHIGTLAIPLSRRAADVTVIEANPNTFRFLAANVALNGCGNVELIEKAAGEAGGVIEFIANHANTGGSKRRPKVADARYFYDSLDIVQVEMDALDKMLEPRFGAIVMDIEGSEYFALLGMKAILRAADKLFIEFVAHHLRNVSGATSDQFYDAVGEEFGHLLVPRTGTYHEGAEIREALRRMVSADCNEEVIVFSKTPFPSNQ